MIKIKWNKILEYADLDQKPIIEWINLGNGTMFRIISFFSHGGLKHPRPGLFVGIERRGCFLFPFNEFIDYDYVQEKLNLMESDARIIADWINAQVGKGDKQQGNYTKRYILENEPTQNFGEKEQLPLVPEIIGEDEGINLIHVW